MCLTQHGCISSVEVSKQYAGRADVFNRSLYVPCSLSLALPRTETRSYWLIHIYRPKKLIGLGRDS